MSEQLELLQEIGFQNVRRQNDRMQKAIDLISGGDLDISSMPTHRYSFQETAKAFEKVAGYQDNVMKALIEL